MSIKISQLEARRRLEVAFDLAVSDEILPEFWYELSRRTFQMPSKTYTPALGTVLLARATDDAIDPLSIKAEYGPNTYSLRTLGHEVLVPAARQLGFSIRNTGREPLNNQPFFRYDHMSTIDRVRDKASHEQFIADVSRVGELDQEQALLALAAFLRVAIEVARQLADYTVDPAGLTLQRTVSAVERFLAEGRDRPKRAQALVAAAFDVTHNDVRSRKLNDPSRDYPGDIQAFEESRAILAVEVRAKAVRPTEVLSFVSACRESRIDRAFMVVLWPGHQPLAVGELREYSLTTGILLTIIEQADDLLLDVFGWADVALETGLKTFAVAGLNRLKEIEAERDSMQLWVDLVGEAGQG